MSFCFAFSYVLRTAKIHFFIEKWKRNVEKKIPKRGKCILQRWKEALCKLTDCNPKQPFCFLFAVFAHFAKCRKRSLKTQKSATSQARISNAACCDCNFRVRRLIFRLRKLGDFACQKVCNFAMKWAILISTLCKTPVCTPQSDVHGRKLLAVNQAVTKFARFKRAFPGKWPKHRPRAFRAILSLLSKMRV